MATHRAPKPGHEPTRDKVDAAHMLATNLYHARRDLDAERLEALKTRLDPALLRATLRPFAGEARDVTLEACGRVVAHVEGEHGPAIHEARAILERLFHFWTIGWRP